MHVTLDRESPLYQAIYKQRTSCERINSQAKDLGIERPKARTMRSVRRLNTLIYIMINAKALQQARAINASLLTPLRSLVAYPEAGVERRLLHSPLACDAEGWFNCPPVS